MTGTGYEWVVGIPVGVLLVFFAALMIKLFDS